MWRNGWVVKKAKKAFPHKGSRIYGVWLNLRLSSELQQSWNPVGSDNWMARLEIRFKIWKKKPNTAYFAHLHRNLQDTQSCVFFRCIHQGQYSSDLPQINGLTWVDPSGFCSGKDKIISSVWTYYSSCGIMWGSFGVKDGELLLWQQSRSGVVLSPVSPDSHVFVNGTP